MAIQFMDDFNSYGTDVNRVNRLFNGVYASGSWLDLVSDPDPSGTGYVICSTNTNFSNLRKVLPATTTTAGVALRHYASSLPSASKEANLIWFQDVNAVSHIVIVLDPSGNLKAYRVDSGGSVLLGTSTTPVITANAWQHIEAKVLLDVAAGTLEVRVEGVTVINLSGIRTTTNTGGAIANCQNISLFGGNGNYGATTYFKDLIIWNGSGGANNNFMGSCQVRRLIPNGDTSLNWTPSSGTTGYNLINETTPDDDAGYIAAPFPAPSPAQFTLTDLPVNVSTVRGVQLMHRSKKTDGGDGNVQVSAVSGANTGNGADRPITTAYTYYWDIFDLDPSGSAWSRTLVNNLQLKLNRTL